MASDGAGNDSGCGNGPCGRPVDLTGKRGDTGREGRDAGEAEAAFAVRMLMIRLVRAILGAVVRACSPFGHRLRKSIPGDRGMVGLGETGDQDQHERRPDAGAEPAEQACRQLPEWRGHGVQASHARFIASVYQHMRERAKMDPDLDQKLLKRWHYNRWPQCPRRGMRENPPGNVRDRSIVRSEAVDRGVSLGTRTGRRSRRSVPELASEEVVEIHRLAAVWPGWPSRAPVMAEFADFNHGPRDRR
jgi:hypothetical protein